MYMQLSTPFAYDLGDMPAPGGLGCNLLLKAPRKVVSIPH